MTISVCHEASQWPWSPPGANAGRETQGGAGAHGREEARRALRNLHRASVSLPRLLGIPAPRGQADGRSWGPGSYEVTLTDSLPRPKAPEASQVPRPEVD